MGSVDLVVWLVIGFSFIGVGSSVVYYFARYYVKTDDKDKELLTQKPLDFTPSATTTSKSQTLTTTVTPPKDLSSALSKTKDSLWGRLSKLTFKSQFDSELREQIEEVLQKLPERERKIQHGSLIGTVQLLGGKRPVDASVGVLVGDADAAARKLDGHKRGDRHDD